jgi:phosphoribosylglycinamide formyltransferase-1
MSSPGFAFANQANIAVNCNILPACLRNNGSATGTMRAMRSIVILISGRGSNMEAIVRAAQTEQWPARIAAVISNRADAEGLKFAVDQGISTAVVANKDYPDREQFDAALRAVIDGFVPDLVVLAGFMRILTAPLVQHYAGRMLNIHPSLLPSFPGMATHRQALATGVKVHGATVHFVTATLDHGPIVAQAAVPVLEDDTEQSLEQRVLIEEHRIYPRAVRWFVENRLSVEDGRVYNSAVEPQY